MTGKLRELCGVEFTVDCREERNMLDATVSDVAFANPTHTNTQAVSKSGGTRERSFSECTVRLSALTRPAALLLARVVGAGIDNRT